MSARPAATIVIPVYNGTNYVAQAIDSALAQTVPVEVVVVDDGSTDGTAALVRGYGEKVRLIQQTNQGVGAALNAGFAAAGGRYIAWLSHDDVAMPEKIEAQLAEFKRDPALGLLYTDFDLIDAGGQVTKTVRSPFFAGEELLRFLLRSTAINGSTVMIDGQKIHVKDGLFKPEFRYVQDGELWIRLLRAGTVFGHLPRALTQYRVHAAAGSNKVKEHFEDIEKMFRGLLRELRLEEVFSEYAGKPATAENRAFFKKWLGDAMSAEWRFFGFSRELYLESVRAWPSPLNPAWRALGRSFIEEPVVRCKRGAVETAKAVLPAGLKTAFKRLRAGRH